MKISRDSIVSRINDVLPEVIELRHALHKFPELAGKEVKTREVLISLIAPYVPVIWQPKLGTDLVFELPGRDPGRVIGFRCDMDGLPIQESPLLPYASEHTGVMHACGHDGHMAILIGAVLVLSGIQEMLPCTIRCIFQPGEEEACMGAELVEKGVCDGLERIYGYHNWPGLPTGAISTKPGILFASANTFTGTITGTATHGATPERGNNPLIPASAAAVQIDDLHRRLQQNEEGVASVCMIRGGRNTNTIPETATIAGTIRYTDATVGNRIAAEIQEIFQGLEEKYDVIVDLVYDRSYYLPVVNDAAAVESVEHAVNTYMGDGVYIPAERHTMASEDFSFYLQQIPGCMFLLGTGVDSPPLHAVNYDFNDDALMHGVLLLVSLALEDVLAD